MPALRAFVVLCLTTLAIGCASPVSTVGPQESHANPPASTPATTVQPAPSTTPSANQEAVAAARQAIESTDLANPDSLDALDALRFSAAGATAAEAVLQGSPGPIVTWAALWVYGTAGVEPGPLKPLLANASPTIRAMAAATLIALGDADGFDVLKEALGDDSPLFGSEPPQTMQGYAAQSLAASVQSAGAPTDEPEDAAVGSVASAWSSWLDQNSGALKFDASTGTWAVP